VDALTGLVARLSEQLEDAGPSAEGQ